MFSFSDLTIFAHRLAANYGHEWATLTSGDEVNRLVRPETDMVTRSRVIAALSEARRSDPQWAGIEAPYCDDHGNWVHSTGTGRLRWEFSTNSIDIEVRRPREDGGSRTVLSWHLFPEQGRQSIRRYGADDFFQQAPGEPDQFEERHVSALVSAIDALAGHKYRALAALNEIKWVDFWEIDPYGSPQRRFRPKTQAEIADEESVIASYSSDDEEA